MATVPHTSAAPFRVVLITSLPPRLLGRILSRLNEDVPLARVCGVLYHQPAPQKFSRRVRSFLRQLRKPAYLRYVLSRVWGKIARGGREVGRTALKWIHAYFPRSEGENDVTVESLAVECRKMGCPFLVTEKLHGEQALAFVRSLQADLGVVYGAPLLKPCLFELPRLGSINIHQRQVPDFRGGGPIGLWELLEGRESLGVTIHRVTAELDAGAVLRTATLPIEPYDSLRSLSLKAHVIGMDLLVQVVTDIVQGTVQELPQSGPSRLFRNPPPEELQQYERQLRTLRPGFQPVRTISTPKLLFRLLVLGLLVPIRNWYRRLTGTFPLIVLYHHLISDRPHYMGISTDSFLNHLEYLRRYYDVVSLSEGLRRLESGRLHQPTVVLTFDDGYRDNYLTSQAILLETDVPATHFICSQRISTEREFDHDVQHETHGFRPFTWEQIRRLEQRGFEFGSHTRNHLDCGTRDVALLEDEIVQSRTDLEEQLGHPVDTFSFPYGFPINISPEAIEIARTHYRYVCSAYSAENSPSGAGPVWHVLRGGHAASLWELELIIQSILCFRRHRAPFEEQPVPLQSQLHPQPGPSTPQFETSVAE